MLGRAHGVRARLRLRACGQRHSTAPLREESAPVVADDDFVDVCPYSELADGEVAEFIVRGVSIAVARVEGRYRAVSNVCPHAGGPIGDGEVEGGLVRCPSHGWGFDLGSGVCDLDPSVRLDTYAVRVRSGQVEVEIPTAG